MKKRIIVMAAGTEDGGGSGFLHLLLAIAKQYLDAEIIGVISTHANGGVKQIATEWNIPFVCMSAPYDETSYQAVVAQLGQPDLIVLWGWLKMVKGIDNFPIVNIHPAPLPEFGGKGMYGLTPHEKVLESGRASTEISIHWVNGVYDGGDVIFTQEVKIQPGDTAKMLQDRVKEYEWFYYPRVIQLILTNQLQLLPELSSLTLPA